MATAVIFIIITVAIQKIKMKEITNIPLEIIQGKIYFLRGEKVMFDRDLAELYGVETKVLNQAVKRNKERFPEDFMFQLSAKEAEIFSRSQIVTLNKSSNLKSQIVTSSSRFQVGILKRGENIKYLPYAFTEQGVAMLSSVLNGKRAIQVNIQIIRTFTMLRKMLATHKELKEKIESMEKKYDKRFRAIFETLKLLIKEEKESEPKRQIGFCEK